MRLGVIALLAVLMPASAMSAPRSPDIIERNTKSRDWEIVVQTARSEGSYKPRWDELTQTWPTTNGPYTVQRSLCVLPSPTFNGYRSQLGRLTRDISVAIGRRVHGPPCARDEPVFKILYLDFSRSEDDPPGINWESMRATCCQDLRVGDAASLDAMPFHHLGLFSIERPFLDGPDGPMIASSLVNRVTFASAGYGDAQGFLNVNERSVITGGACFIAPSPNLTATKLQRCVLRGVGLISTQASDTASAAAALAQLSQLYHETEAKK